MTSETMRFLLDKLPKKALINSIIQMYESVFTDPKELKEAYHKLAVYIQAKEVYDGGTKLMKFVEPFRSEVQKQCMEWAEQFGVPR